MKASSTLLTIPLVPYDVQQRRLRRRVRRGLRSRNDTSASGGPGTAAYATATAQLYVGYGTHYVDLWCGRPVPQRQTVIVDTGSDATAFPCSGGCETRCGVPEHHASSIVYQTHQSSTFRNVTSCSDCLKGSCRRSSNAPPSLPSCHVEMHYREGSGWTAHEVRDLCYVGGFHHNASSVPATVLSSSRSEAGTASSATAADDTDGLNPAHASRFEFPLQFACQTKVSGAFRTQLADGILGLQPGSPASLYNQLWQHSLLATHSNSDVPPVFGMMRRGAFSLCFAPAHFRNRSVGRRGISAGLLTLGGSDPRLNAPGARTVYSRHGTGATTSWQRKRYFGVEVRYLYLVPPASDAPRAAIRLNVSEADLNRYQVIVDSGSTDTYLTSEAEGPFQRVWKSMVGREFEPDAPLDSLSQLPTIVFQLKGLERQNSRVLQQERRLPSTTSLLVGSAANRNDDGSWIVSDPNHPLDVLLALEPHHYTEPKNRKKGQQYEPRFHFDEGRDSALGASALLGYHLLLDPQSNRLGWARSSCNYSEIVQEGLRRDKNLETVEGYGDDEDDAEDDVFGASLAEQTLRTSVRPAARDASDHISSANGTGDAPQSESALAANRDRPHPKSLILATDGTVCDGLPLCHMQSWMAAETTVAMLLLVILTVLWRDRRAKASRSCRPGSTRTCEDADSSRSDGGTASETGERKTVHKWN